MRDGKHTAARPTLPSALLADVADRPPRRSFGILFGRGLGCFSLGRPLGTQLWEVEGHPPDQPKVPRRSG